MVEVTQNDDEAASIVWSQGAVVWHFDVVKCHESSSGSRAIRCVDVLSLDAFASLNQEYNEPFVGLAPRDKIISKMAVSDPFLLNVSGSPFDLSRR